MTVHHLPGERVEDRSPAPSLADLSFTADELAGRPAPSRPWHVPNMIPVRAVTLLQGDGGTGKSVLALQLAVATALGRPWLGQPVRGGNALYVSAEDDRDEIHRRLEAITLDYGIDLAELSALKVVDVTGQDAVLATGDRQGRLGPTERWTDLQTLIDDWEPALVVIDNLADAFAGEENSRPHARQFIGLLQGCAKRRDASVLLIGHPSLAGMASGTGSSGSTAWNNSVRSRLYLTRPAGEDGAPSAPDLRVLTVKKANYAPANVEVRLRWSAGAFTADEAHGDRLGIVDRQAAETRIERLFLELLEANSAQGRIVSDSAGRNYAPHLFASDPRAEGVTRKGFEAAMQRLFAARRIRIVTTGKGSHARRQIAIDGE